MHASEGGFTSSYFLDDETCPSYRCFLYFGNEIEPSPDRLEISSWERQHAGLVAHLEADSITLVNNHGTIPTRALNMKSFFDEGSRKLRMHPGDIVIVKGGSPFAIDLPILFQVPRAEMISWCLYDVNESRYSGKGEEFGIHCFHLPDTPMAIKPIEERDYTDDEARASYDAEMTEIADALYDNHSPHEMERLRITPGVFHPDDILQKAKRDMNVLEVHSREF